MPNRSIRDEIQKPVRSYGAPMSEKPSNFKDRPKVGQVDEAKRRAALDAALGPSPTRASQPRPVVRGKGGTSTLTLPNSGGRQRRATIDKLVDGT